MGSTTPIEWTDATWNPVGGCSIKSPGCINCYAQQLAGTRLAKHPLYAGTTDRVKGKPVFNGKLTVAADDHPTWIWPLRWRGAKAPKLGEGQPSLIFVGDMSDLFHENRPTADIDRVAAALLYSQHIGQLLTKRPDRSAAYFTELKQSGRWIGFNHPLSGKPNWDPMLVTFKGRLPSLWLGTSVERQQEADERRPHLEKASVLGFTTFVSYEPAIGPVDWRGWEFVDQIISGGESGRDNPRPSHPEWHRATRDFCQAHGIAFFFKQWGAWQPFQPPMVYDESWEESGNTVLAIDGAVSSGDKFGGGPEQRPLWCRIRNVDKKAAGRLLDGREHNGFPKANRGVARRALEAAL